MGKKGKGKEKGPQKPDGMSDEMWALFNNTVDLIQNLRGSCVFNTIQCTLTKTQAAMFLWGQAVASVAKREEIVQLGAVPQAIGALKTVEDHEKPPVVGLLHCLSSVEVAREQFANTKAVPPHPGIALVPLLWESLNTNSTATEVGITGTLNNLSQSAESKGVVLKELNNRGPQLIIQVMASSLSCLARADAASCLLHCITPAVFGAETSESVKEREKDRVLDLKTLYVENNIVGACLQMLAGCCSECNSGVRQFRIPAMENCAFLLQKMLILEEAKQTCLKAGGVGILCKLLSDKVPKLELSLQAKAYAAGCIYMVAVPRGIDDDMLGSISTYIHASVPVDPDMVPLPMDELDEEPVQKPDRSAEAAEGVAIMKDIAVMLTSQVQLIAEEHAIPALVSLCQGPVMPEGGGKKKKKAKEPPVAPDMADAQMNAAGCLRLLSLFIENRAAIVGAGALPFLTKLLDSKTEATRLHAQGALLNLGADAVVREQMQENKVPEYITGLSWPPTKNDVAPV